MSLAALANVAALLTLPFVLTGLIVRVKALWAGRRGPPILQPAWDALRLLRKTPVYSEVSTPVFRAAPWVLLLTSLCAALVTPLLGTTAVLSFGFDFVVLAYAWGLGRLALMLAALDTGSSFEGMGAAREATFSTLVEPALFLVLGALCLFSHTTSLAHALALDVRGGPSALLWATSVAALLVVLQAETARLPVDDPTTHLELTMVHEVMVLDHSGPELAAIQVGSALKLTVATAALAMLLNPRAGDGTLASAVLTVGLSLLLAAVVATVESLMARFKLRAVPQYLGVAVGAGVLALLAVTWKTGVPQ
ncbi:MAG: NADH-quinone oxidoreductase subunit H [Myxococcota bacterium]|jgi:formate hydrogenlyase subunit 4